MAQFTLMPATGVATVGSSVNISTRTTQVSLQFTPQPALGFSGVVVIDSSSAPNPGISDWFPVATLTFSSHTSSVAINLYVSNNPWLRARIVDPTIGSMSVYMAF